VSLQEIGWYKGGAVSAGDNIFVLWKRNENHQVGRGFFVHYRMVMAGRRKRFS